MNLEVLRNLWAWIGTLPIRLMVADAVPGMPTGGGVPAPASGAPVGPGAVTGTAQAAKSGGAPSPMSMLPLLIIIVVMFAMMLIPNWRQQKKRTEMMNSLKEGDKVITIGGIVGRIKKIKGDVVTLTIADKVDVVISRTGVSGKTDLGA